MLAAATEQFLKRACRGAVTPPTVIIGEDGPFCRDGKLYLRVADGWPAVAQTFVASLFWKVHTHEVHPASEDLRFALAFASRYATVKCANESCGQKMGLPASCPLCFVSINSV